MNFTNLKMLLHTVGWVYKASSSIPQAHSTLLCRLQKALRQQTGKVSPASFNKADFLQMTSQRLQYDKQVLQCQTTNFKYAEVKYFFLKK